VLTPGGTIEAHKHHFQNITELGNNYTFGGDIGLLPSHAYRWFSGHNKKRQ